MFRRKPTEVFLLASTLLAGCGALFGIDDPERPPSGDASGEGGTSGGGKSGGGAGGTVEPQGGSGMAGDGGEVATGGSSGTATGGGDTRGGTAGSSGAGGDGGGGDGGGDGDEFPSKGDPCSTPGALACAGPAQNGRFICEGGVWTETVRCVDETDKPSNCDRRSGVCADVRSECRSESLSYQYALCPKGGSTAESCGPDLVSIVVEQCDIGCSRDRQNCAEPSGGELLVDRLPPTGEDFVFWPTPIIPVCFRDESDAFGAEQAAIRGEIESTWGRYSSIAFSGWNGCSSSPEDLAEARVSIVENCKGELARIPRYGYPGPGAKLELDICRSYVDANDANHATQMLDDATLRYVARHLFGHVLGREHMSGDFMSPLLDPSLISELVFNEATIDMLQQTYGTKPSGSLVNASGRCVGWSNESAVDKVVDMRVCDGSTETRWQALEGRLVAEGGTDCLRASGSEPASLDTCGTTPDFVWETNDVQWRGHTGRCVTKSTASIYWSLVLEPCRALGDADQTWSFDFYDDRRVRIRRADGQCVHIPEADGGPPRWPELAPCDAGDGARDGLEITRNGQLSLSGYCMFGRATNEVYLAPCETNPNQSFYLSGPLGHDAGTVLTLFSEPELNASPMSGAPSQAQIFDYHF